MCAVINKNCGLGARGAGAVAIVEDHGFLAATLPAAQSGQACTILQSGASWDRTKTRKL
jgi:hypothetical protein